MYAIRTNIEKGNVVIPQKWKTLPEGTECLVIFRLPNDRPSSFNKLYTMGDRAVPTIHPIISEIDRILYSDPHR
jgi:hypothetical protein